MARSEDGNNKKEHTANLSEIFRNGRDGNKEFIRYLSIFLTVALASATGLYKHQVGAYDSER